MDGPLGTFNRFFARLPGRLRARRRTVWALIAVCAAVLSAGVGFLEVDMTPESFFVEDDPTLVMHRSFKEVFGSDEDVYIVYEALDGDVFSRASLSAVKSLQDALLGAVGEGEMSRPLALDSILDVQTIVNAGYLEVRGETLVSRDFVEQLPETAAEIEQLRRLALAYEGFPGFFVSPDSRYGGVWIRTDFGRPEVEEVDVFASEGLDPALEAALSDAPERSSSERPTEMAEYAEFSRALVSAIEVPAVTDALALNAVGNPVLMGFFNDVLLPEADLLAGGAMLVMMVVLAVLFRSVAGVVWPLVLVTLCWAIAFGIAGWLGLAMSMMISALGILLLVVGIADSIHILSGYVFFRGQGAGHEEALEKVYAKSGLACFLTSVTTSLGLLALWIVPIPPVQNFATAAAIGVMVAFLITVVVLPLMLDLWPLGDRAKGGSGHRRLQEMLARASDLAQRRPTAILVVFGLAGLVGVFGVTQVRVDSNLLEIIRPGLPIRVAYDLVDRVMGGSQGMEIYVDFGRADAMQDPVVLRAVDEMQSLLEREHPSFVVRTDSLANAAKRSFRVLNEDRPEYYAIPEERDVLAQTLLLFDMAAPEDREVLVPDDYSAGRITVRLFNYGSSEYSAFFGEVRREIDDVFGPLRVDYPEMRIGLAGGLPLIMGMADAYSRAQIESFGLVLVVVTVLLLGVFGSVRVGLVAMVPNVYPALITFGVMGLGNIPLDVDTLVIAPMLIGIAVDDTIHFVTHYRVFLAETGDGWSAIRRTLHEVGQAIVFTSVILVLGFLVLILSNHEGLANFGLLIAVAFGTALLADLLLLPVLLSLMDEGFGRRSDGSG